MVEERVSLGEVDYVDSYHVCEALRFLHPEIKPLDVAGTVGIVSDPEVVFDEGSLTDLVDVAALELCVEFDVAGQVLR